MKNFLKPSNNSIPFVHLAKKQDNVWWQVALWYAAGILCALILGAIFIACVDVNPFEFYGKMLSGCFKNKIYIRGFLRIVSPLLITSLGIAVAFKMKFWNIGAEGQFLMGSLLATTTAMLIGNTMSPSATLFLVIISGTIGGGLFGIITAIFKVTWGTNETLLTLMFNYIALYIVKYMQKVDLFRVPNSRPEFAMLPENSWLIEFKIGNVDVDISLFIAIALVLVVFIYHNYTKHGYEISIVGDSLNTAKYAGMNVKKIILRTMFVSSSIIGLAGALQVTSSATVHTLSENATGGVGWTGIIVAWLAKLNPIAIFVISIFMAILTKGASVASSALHTSVAVAEVLKGIILFTILATDFFINYKVVFRTSPLDFIKKHLNKKNNSVQNVALDMVSSVENSTSIDNETVSQDTVVEEQIDTEEKDENSKGGTN